MNSYFSEQVQKRGRPQQGDVENSEDPMCPKSLVLMVAGDSKRLDMTRIGVAKKWG